MKVEGQISVLFKGLRGFIAESSNFYMKIHWRGVKYKTNLVKDKKTIKDYFILPYNSEKDCKEIIVCLWKFNTFLRNKCIGKVYISLEDLEKLKQTDRWFEIIENETNKTIGEVNISLEIQTNEEKEQKRAQGAYGVADSSALYPYNSPQVPHSTSARLPNHQAPQSKTVHSQPYTHQLPYNPYPYNYGQEYYYPQQPINQNCQPQATAQPYLTVPQLNGADIQNKKSKNAKKSDIEYIQDILPQCTKEEIKEALHLNNDDTEETINYLLQKIVAAAASANSEQVHKLQHEAQGNVPTYSWQDATSAQVPVNAQPTAPTGNQVPLPTSSTTMNDSISSPAGLITPVNHPSVSTTSVPVIIPGVAHAPVASPPSVPYNPPSYAAYGSAFPAHYGYIPAPMYMPVRIQTTGRRKAVLIGINYTGTRCALRGCVNDVRRMRMMLVQIFGFVDSSMTMVCLTDDSFDPQYRPTKNNILSALRWLTLSNVPGDSLFFHFSGHGSRQRDASGIEEDGYDETILPVDFEQNGQIVDDELHAYLVQPLQSGARLTAVMDCCHSGTGLDVPFEWNQQKWRWEEETNPFYVLGDVQLFSGCRDDETSADLQSGAAAGGAMTTAFVTTLTTTPFGHSYPSLLDALTQSMKNRGLSQRPQLTSSQKFEFNRPFNFTDCTQNLNPNLGRKVRRIKRASERMSMGGIGPPLMMGATGLATGLLIASLLDS